MNFVSTLRPAQSARNIARYTHTRLYSLHVYVCFIAVSSGDYSELTVRRANDYDDDIAVRVWWPRAICHGRCFFFRRGHTRGFYETGTFCVVHVTRRADSGAKTKRDEVRIFIARNSSSTRLGRCNNNNNNDNVITYTRS